MSSGTTSDYRRKNTLRLPDYDYRQSGMYFVTCCTYQHQALFGQVRDETMLPNQFGNIVTQVWHGLPRHYPQLRLDTFCLMPDHIHAIISLNDEDTASRTRASSRHGLPEIIRAFKSFSAREINRLRRSQGKPVWQRGYYDRIIRDEKEYLRIAEYIRTNPLRRWLADACNCEFDEGEGNLFNF